LAEDAIMLDVFDNPMRFRFAIIGRQIELEYGRSISRKFVDELEQKPPILRRSAVSESNTNRRPIFRAAYQPAQKAIPGWFFHSGVKVVSACDWQQSLADDRALANLFFDCRY
jgi:hypothetical protein